MERNRNNSRTKMYHDLLNRHIRHGSLKLIEADGTEHAFGEGEPTVTWRVRDKKVMRQVVTNPHMNLGETYMDERWDVVSGTLADLLRILRVNVEAAFKSGVKLTPFSALLSSWNTVRTSLKNVAHHYDLEEDLFRRFLDTDMHYSCAYFEDEDQSLEEAQQAKCELIRKKLCLEPGMRVIDIGSGWGSLAMYLAEKAGVEVVGITLSVEQLRVAEERAKARGLHNQVRFRLEDYRNHEGEYDAVVSVGMFEHVGLRNHETYFNKVAELLKPDGVALIHTIGSIAPPQPVNPWIRRHIFPGGYIPPNSMTSAAIEKSGLVTSDIEVLRRHYAKTLEVWNDRFQASRTEFQERLGERFCRMWEFYLVSCQTAFEVADLVVYHYQLAHDNARVPLTRAYLA